MKILEFITEADDFKTEIRKKKAFRRGQDDATNSKPKAVPSEFAELKQTYLKGYKAGEGTGSPNVWREKTNEDDYWGDTSQANAERDAEYQSEKEAGMLDFVKNLVDWEDRVLINNGEIYYSVPRDQAEIHRVEHDPIMKSQMRNDMRIQAEDLIEELRIRYETDYEIVKLGPWSYAVEEAS